MGSGDLDLKPGTPAVDLRSGAPVRSVSPRLLAWLRRLCWVLLAGAAAVVAARLIGIERTPIVQLLVFTPWLLFVLPVLAVAGWRLRARWTALIALALLIVVAVWQAPTFGIGATHGPPGAGQRVRVLTLNTLVGDADAGEIVAQVRAQAVDLLVLEELTPGLADRLRAQGLGTLLPHGGTNDDGEGGTVIWSRWPMTRLPGAPGAAYEMPRRVLTLPNGRRVTVTGVHTQSPVPREVTRWRADMAAVQEAVWATSGPQIVLGDFNATRDHRSLRHMLTGAPGLLDAAESVGLAAWPGFTWPADGGVVPAFMRLDHVLVTSSSVRVDDLVTVGIARTDHRGVIATLTVVG